MRVHLSNSVCGLLEYVAQPAALLLAAPILLHHLGLAPYGLWLLASVTVSAGGIVSSGFGDAVIQRVASLRSSNDAPGIRRVISNMLAINLVLSTALASLLWLSLPFAATRFTQSVPGLRLSCLWSLRLGALLIIIMSIQSVFTSAHRAFERYVPVVLISVTTRLVAIALSVVIATRGGGIVALMVGTAAVTIAGAVAQWAALRYHLGPGLLRPSLDRRTLTKLASFGGFSWMQAVAGVLFGQADRLILGAAAGASAVTVYSLCVQLAQPIHGLTAAGLHFLFPHLASRHIGEAAATLRRSVLAASALNLVIAIALTSLVLIFGTPIFTLWLGPAFARNTATLLPLIAVGFGLLAANVVPHYALMAFGYVRLVAAANLAGGVLMLILMALLLPSHGVHGAALARLVYGPLTLLLYIPLLHRLRAPGAADVPFSSVRMEEA